jgi:hypothetical protein
MGRDTPRRRPKESRACAEPTRRANEADVSALVDLFAPDTVWYGFERRRFWLWRSAPS